MCIINHLSSFSLKDFQAIIFLSYKIWQWWQWTFLTYSQNQRPIVLWSHSLKINDVNQKGCEKYKSVASSSKERGQCTGQTVSGLPSSALNWIIRHPSLYPLMLKVPLIRSESLSAFAEGTLCEEAKMLLAGILTCTIHWSLNHFVLL